MVSDWIIENMADHEKYVEPFGGAAAILFAKPRSPIEIYNDLDGDIANFFEVLRDRGDELRDWLRRTPYSREKHNEFAEAWYSDSDKSKPEDDLARAGQFFYLRYTQWNGKHGKATEIQHRGGKRAEEFSNGVEALEWFEERMQGVMVEKLDYAELVDEHTGEDTLFYFDPDLSGWTTDDLFEVECIIDPEDFMEVMEQIDESGGYFIVSVLEESLPDQWREDPNLWVMRNKTRGFEEHIVMNYNPNNTARFLGEGTAEADAIEW